MRAGERVVLSEQEKKEWADRYRKELEMTFDRRRAVTSRRDDRPGARVEEQRNFEIARIQHEVSDQFWKERGYRKYIDTRGHAHWVTEDEYQRRATRRQNRSTQVPKANIVQYLSRTSFVYVGMAMLALALGLMLIR